MEQSYVVWADGTLSRNSHHSKAAAHLWLHVVLAQGKDRAGKIFPVAAFVVRAWATCAKQDSGGHWYYYDVYAEDGKAEVACTAPTGWWTDKVYKFQGS